MTKNEIELRKNHLADLTIAKEHLDQKNYIGGICANFSKHFNLKRIAANYFKIPSGYRTSHPHAESHEEEFIFVISGEVDLWYNGNIKKMIAGDSIGFLPGTGIGHTFINNSSAPVELFVSGERTKKENTCHFHLEENSIELDGDMFWKDFPKQALGGHNGLPGIFDKGLIDENIIVVNGPKNILDSSFSYPGDTETFGHGLCLSREFKLKNTAIWIEKLPPTKRSSWPHAHSVEEEFVFVLSGSPTVILDDQSIKLSPMTAVDFKAGSKVSHTIFNDTHEDIYYLCVGESNPVNDKIFYPHHPLRNEEVKEKGLLWEI